MASNARLGIAVLLVAAFVQVYYTLWTLIWPFMLIDEGNFINSFFPPLEYAFIIPSVFGVTFIGGISIYTFYHLSDCLKN